MPFDSTDFPERRDQPLRRPRHDTAITVVIVLLAAILLLMPISLAAAGDIVRYVMR
jgi:hypothetical protein